MIWSSGWSLTLTFVIDMDARAALARGLARRSGEDRFEELGLGFQESLRAGFLALVREYPDRVQIIDGARAPDDIAQDVGRARGGASGMNDLPDLPDQREGAPHPCATPLLFGQQAAEAAFLQAFGSGRMHHAWLLSGPMGVGKATLAWRIARFLLAGDGGGMFGPPDTLDVPEDHPTVRRLRAGADGGLLVIRRGLDDKGNLRRDITVDVMRRLHGFFGLSAARWRANGRGIRCPPTEN